MMPLFSKDTYICSSASAALAGLNSYTMMGGEVDIDNARRHSPLSVRCARPQHIAEHYWLELVKLTGSLTGHEESLGHTFIQGVVFQ
jgi:hypothetical protein